MDEQIALAREQRLAQAGREHTATAELGQGCARHIPFARDRHELDRATGGCGQCIGDPLRLRQGEGAAAGAQTQRSAHCRTSGISRGSMRRPV